MIPLTYIPLFIGIVAFSVWARHIQPPLPWWNIGIVIGGALLFLIVSFLAFHRVRKERDKDREKIRQLSQIKVGDNDVASKATTVKSRPTTISGMVVSRAGLEPAIT